MYRVSSVAAILFISTMAIAAPPEMPNIVFILADDLGSAEVGCYGQKKIRTPHIDKLAAEGMRFTQFYSGNAVCAPSRCCLMTGKHPGHAIVRDNKAMKPEGQYPLPAGTTTIGTLLKARGYSTGAMGKWGLGPPASTGDPNNQGIDYFFGYNCQAQAHNFYPTYLWRNDKKVELEGNTRGLTGKQYSHDLMEKEAMEFLERCKDKPFFLYLPFTIPHVAIQVPDDSLEEYRGKFEEIPYKGDKGYLPHPTPRAAYAGMVTRMDRSVGRVVQKLKDLKLDENTIVFFSSDNGPTHNVGGADSTFFESAGKLRGLKGSLYEGGIRTPFIVRWPGQIRPGTISDLPGAFWDVLPTMCELTGSEIPKDTDGLSIVPTLLGRDGQKRHEFLYWEFPGYGGQHAVRMGDWKGVRQNMNKGRTDIELYNLKTDPNEEINVASRNPDVVARIERLMKEQHTASAVFPLKPIDAPAKK
jgi:arylsulfatase